MKFNLKDPFVQAVPVPICISQPLIIDFCLIDKNYSIRHLQNILGYIQGLACKPQQSNASDVRRPEKNRPRP